MTKLTRYQQELCMNLCSLLPEDKDLLNETIIEYETEYVYLTDTIFEIEYIDVYITEYIDCETGMPCSTNLPEILKESEETGLMYNIMGQPIKRPESIYIHDGKVKYIMN